MNILRLQHASVLRNNHQALNNINLTIPLGQHHAVLGPNGAGKSTLLKLICRDLYPAYNAQTVIELFGQSRPTLWDLRKQIGLVSTDLQSNFQVHANGLEVVSSAFFSSVGIHTHHHVSPEQHELAYAMLDQLEISALANRAYTQLSTGQQRRLLFARALVHRPQALILDEPTNGLDIKAKFWFIAKLEQLASSGTSLILVTHDTLDIIPQIQHVTLLKHGEIFYTGSKQDSLSDDRLSTLYETPIHSECHNGFYQLTPS